MTILPTSSTLPQSFPSLFSHVSFPSSLSYLHVLFEDRLYVLTIIIIIILPYSLVFPFTLQALSYSVCLSCPVVCLSVSLSVNFVLFHFSLVYQ